MILFSCLSFGEGYMTEMRNIIKSQPVTGSERILAKLCEKSFLSLWSFPNVYTDDGIAKGQGRELCDLLVVFNEHVLIFSDKGEVRFSAEKDLSVAWPRWVKKAFFKSAYQIYQAEKWIKNFSSRIFIDNKCTQPFPVQIPSADNIKIHRIVVTRGISEHVKKYFGGDSSGTLMLLPHLVGEDEHFKMPFQIGFPDESKKFVHFFDDESIDIVFKEFDTISDFTSYLTDKENLLTTKMVSISGEEDLIGLYLSSIGEDSISKRLNFRGFDNFKTVDAFVITGGIYDDFKSKGMYKAIKEYVKNSYYWDSLIERIGQHAFTGNWGYTSARSYDEEIIPLKYMAAESRISRTILSNGFAEWAWPAFEQDATQPRVRILHSPSSSDVCYVLLILPHSLKYPNYDSYREDRKFFLSTYCFACKDLYPECSITVGLALDPRSPTRFGGYCEDMIYMDSSDWSEEEFKDAKKIRDELGYFQKMSFCTANYTYSDKKEGIIVSEMRKVIRYKAKKEKDRKRKAQKQRRRDRKSK